MKKDWIEQVNDLVGDGPKADRDLVEVLIMFVNERRLGEQFLDYLRQHPTPEMEKSGGV